MPKHGLQCWPALTYAEGMTMIWANPLPDNNSTLANCALFDQYTVQVWVAVCGNSHIKWWTIQLQSSIHCINTILLAVLTCTANLETAVSKPEVKKTAASV